MNCTLKWDKDLEFLVGVFGGIYWWILVVGFFGSSWEQNGFSSDMTSTVNIVIITHLIITLKMINSLGQCFDEVWNVVWKVCKRILCFTLLASDYIYGASVIMNIRRTNLVAYLNTVKPESSRLAFMTLYAYYTSKGHDSCAMNQENSQLQKKN